MNLENVRQELNDLLTQYSDLAHRITLLAQIIFELEHSVSPSPLPRKA